ncbi:MAG: hypothetical protein ABSD20_14350 [Terriglobales bacterium]|jgi:hypothetical protein
MYFQNAHYDRYRKLLARAQALGDGTVAVSAARMLLYCLREQFQALPAEKKQLLKSNLLVEETAA